MLAGRLPVNFFNVNPFVASARAMTNNSFSTCHALEVEVRRRFAQDFTLQANYNLSKALSDFDGDENTLLNEDRITRRNPRYEYGEIAPRQTFNANWIYELPLGPGKRLGAGATGFRRRLLAGWQVGGIVSARSGRPITILSGVGTFTRSALSDSNTADLSRPMTNGELRELTGRRSLATGQGTGGVFWIDPSLSRTLFVLPPPGRAGNLPQTPVFGPGRFTTDLNISKRTRLNERANLEFRWEIFNAFNHVNFNVPETDILSPSFGQIFRTVTNPRLMQVALKVNF